MSTRPRIYAVDFDGTLCENNFRSEERRVGKECM